MSSVGHHQFTDIRPPHRSATSHIPGEEGWPLVGNTLKILANPRAFVEMMGDRYGPVYRSRSFGETNVTLLGPEGNECALLDSRKLLSSRLGWGPLLGTLFPRGLMLLDFDEHRLHRRALSVAFKAEPMKSYLEKLNTGLASHIARWPRGREIVIYPLIKQLTLDLAATSFLGTKLGSEAETIKQAFIAMVAATIAIVRSPLPGTKMRKGMEGRAIVIDYFKRQIPIRREAGGDDLFSQLCRATYEDGSLLSEQDVVDHMSFMMVAAHDTLTSSLVSLIYRLAANPEWQDRVRSECRQLGLARGEPPGSEHLDALALTTMVFKEALRMAPPLPSIPRRAVREFEFNGFRVPAGTAVCIDPLHTHHMPEIWPEPDRYDPTRFEEKPSRLRHKFAYVPFGGGMHMCLGVHFAFMQAKCFVWHLLQSVQVSIRRDYAPRWQMYPIPHPSDGLRVTLEPID